MLDRMMGRLLSLVGVLALAGTLAGEAGAQGQPVKIGFSLPKTGIFAPGAPSQENAYVLWREQVNARGGLNVAGTRRPVEFVQYDDQSDPAKAVQIYEKLITDDKVDLVFAPWGTAHHFALAGLLERLKVPMMGNTAASVRIRELQAKYIWFPASGMPDDLAKGLADLMKTQNVKTAAVLTLQLPFSLEVRQHVMPALEKAGIKVVASSDYPPTVKDMTAQLSSVKAAKPDAVLSLSYPSDSVLYMNQARSLGIDAPFQLVLIGPSIPFFGTMFGPAADGIVSLGQWTPHQKKWPRAAPFYAAYKKRFNSEPDYLDTAIAYLSCEIVEQAVAKAGLDREKLRETYATGTFETISGKLSFKGVQNNSPTVIAQIQAGQTHIVWPPELATSQYQPKGPWPKN
jgi:branched-chain amino acid transport system substrate-binding protein